MKQNRVLRFFKLPSLLVPDSPCRFVVSVGFPRHPHVVRPALRVRTAVHVQTVAQNHLSVIVDVAAQILHVTGTLHTGLLDDGNFFLLPSVPKSYFVSSCHDSAIRKKCNPWYGSFSLIAFPSLRALR